MKWNKLNVYSSIWTTNFHRNSTKWASNN